MPHELFQTFVEHERTEETVVDSEGPGARANFDAADHTTQVQVRSQRQGDTRRVLLLLRRRRRKAGRSLFPSDRDSDPSESS